MLFFLLLLLLLSSPPWLLLPPRLSKALWSLLFLLLHPLLFLLLR